MKRTYHTLSLIVLLFTMSSPCMSSVTKAQNYTFKIIISHDTTFNTSTWLKAKERLKSLIGYFNSTANDTSYEQFRKDIEKTCEEIKFIYHLTRNSGCIIKITLHDQEELAIDANAHDEYSDMVLRISFKIDNNIPEENRVNIDQVLLNFSKNEAEIDTIINDLNSILQEVFMRFVGEAHIRIDLH